MGPFCYPSMGSNPVRGAKPRKRASVFRRSARGADTRRSGGGRRSRTRIPLVSTTCNVRGLNLGWDLFCYPLRGSNPLAIPIFQMKQKIPFSAVDMQSKWDYLLHLERGTPTAHEVRSRAEAEMATRRSGDGRRSAATHRGGNGHRSRTRRGAACPKLNKLVSKSRERLRHMRAIRAYACSFTSAALLRL